MDFLFNESTQRCSMYSSQIKQWIPCGLPTTTASSLVITQPMTLSEATFLGALNCVLILISIVPYVVILVILSSGKDYSSDSYRIMFHLGVADCIQLVMQFPPSIWHVIGGNDFHFVGNKLFGSFLNAGWISYVILTLLLAVNRLLTMVGGAKAEEFIIGRYLGAFITVCWIWGFVFFVAYLTPHLQIAYNPASMIWVYAGNEPIHSTTRKIAIYSALAEIVLTALAYIVICCYLCYGSHCDRKHLLMNQSKRAGRVRKREIRILLQAVLIAGFAMLVLIYWNYYWVLFSDTKWVFYIANLLWILNGGVNPAIYLALNSSIRKRVLGLFSRTACDSTTVASTSPFQSLTISANATCLYFVSCLAEISPIVPVNQPFSPYYRYGLGSGRGYASSSLPFSSSPYGECRLCCPARCSGLGGTVGGSYYGALPPTSAIYSRYGSSYPITAGYGTVGYSGYEGPGGGYSNYLQPAISYPPLGITSSGLVGSPTLSMAGDCQDQSSQCALWASTGQCATSAEYVRRVCPQSCGTGCLSNTISSYGTLSPGYGLRSGYDVYGTMPKYGLDLGSTLFGSAAHGLGPGYGIDSLLNPLYKNDIGGHGAGGVIGPGYGSDSTFGPYGLASGYGLDPLYGLNYGLGSGLSSNGLGLMDGLISSYGIGSGLGSALGLYSGRGLIADDGLGARPIMNPLYGYGSGYNLGLGSGFDMNGLHSGYGLYGNDYYGGLGAYRSGIYPYSLKEKKASTLKSTDRDEKYHEGRATLTRITGTRRQ